MVSFSFFSVCSARDKMLSPAAKTQLKVPIYFAGEINGIKRLFPFILLLHTCYARSLVDCREENRLSVE
jgi:hypothetical protein